MRAPPDRMSLAPSGPADGAGVVTPAPEVAQGSAPLWGPGTRFSTYEIDSLLSSGGMAEVWRARIVGMEGFEKRIVIKTMLTKFQGRPDLVEMFIREASLAARLNHPNIVDVIDFGQLEGRYFIAMEYVTGMSLRFAQKRLRAQGRRLPIPAALHVARDVCEALQYMHDLEDASGTMGLVHRDLSPDNIMLSTSGTAKLIDFGAARATERTPPSKAFIGRFRYAAPERIRQESEDHRSDIYSLGVILYECVAGARPFEGSDVDVIRAVTSSVACDPLLKAPDLPPSVAEVVKKATAADPKQRFASAQAMGTALARCLVALQATNKEREVTAALATVLDPTHGARPPETSASPSAALEAVPQPVAAVEEFSGSPQLAVSEREMLEASGPIREGAVPAGPMPAADTKRNEIPLPPEAFPEKSERAGRRKARANTLPATPDDRAAALFDQGIKLRLEGRYEDALSAWEMALRLAPENHLYESHVNKLRAHVLQRRP